MTQAQIDPIFTELRTFLPGLVDRVIERRPKPLPLAGHFPRQNQETLARALMATIGFDFEHGRLDSSHHPFCGGDPDDTRITTRYDESDFLSSLMAVLHETGHAMYEQGLPRALARTARWRSGRHGGAREPVAADGNAGVSRP